MSKTTPLFVGIDYDLLEELRKIIFDFRYIDPEKKPDPIDLGKPLREQRTRKENIKPEFRESNSPASMIIYSWQQYLSLAQIQGVHDTKIKRGVCAFNLQHILGRKLSGEDFKKSFELPDKFDEICQIIDEDIKNLTS